MWSSLQVVRDRLGALRERLTALAPGSLSPTAKKFIAVSAVCYGAIELYYYLQYRKALARTQESVVFTGQTDHAYREWMANELVTNLAEEPEDSKETVEAMFGHRWQSHELYRENVVAAVGFVMFHTPKERWTPEEKQRVQEVVASFEKQMVAVYGHGFRPGFEPEHDCALRKFGCVALNPWYKPIFIYAAIFGYRSVLLSFLRLYGFTKHEGDKGLTFWVRKHPTSHHRPLMFCHGLGVGVAPYLLPVLSMAKNRTVILPEMPNISFGRFVDEFPSGHETAIATEKMLKQLGFGSQKLDILGHSYGTITMTYLNRNLPNRFHRKIYCDPACFLGGASKTGSLCMNNYFRGVCHMSWTYPLRHPLDWLNRTIMYWFIARDFYVQEMSLRRCWGTHMWERGDHMDDNSMVLLAENDELLPGPLLYRYIRRRWGDSCHILYHNGAHATFLMDQQLWRGIRKFLDAGKAGLDGTNIEDSMSGTIPPGMLLTNKERRKELRQHHEEMVAKMDALAEQHIKEKFMAPTRAEGETDLLSNGKI